MKVKVIFVEERISISLCCNSVHRSLKRLLHTLPKKSQGGQTRLLLWYRSPTANPPENPSETFLSSLTLSLCSEDPFPNSPLSNLETKNRLFLCCIFILFLPFVLCTYINISSWAYVRLPEAPNNHLSQTGL